MPPTMLMDVLQGVRRRVRVLEVLFGLGVVVTAAVAALLVTVLLDYLLNLPPVPRLVIMLLAAGVVAYALWQWIARPLMARLTVGDIAGRLEEAFPEFDDRLRSTVTFYTQDVPGSDLMKQRVVSETASLVQRLDLNRALVMTPVWTSLATALGAVLIVAALWFSIGSTYRSAALARLFSPFGENAWPKRVQIEMLGDVPQRVPVGQRVPIQMKLAKGDNPNLKAVILYRYGDQGPWQQELMARDGDGTYTASLDARIGSGAEEGTLQVQLRAGDDQRRLETIHILPRLMVNSVEAVVTPPAYIAPDGQSLRFNLVAGSAIVPVGSTVQLHLSFNKPLDASQPIGLEPVAVDMVVPDIQWQRDSETTVIGSFVAEQSLRFHVQATDVDGFRSSGIEEYDLVVRPDQEPLVQIEIPRRNEERTPVAVVPLQGMIEDDYGIQAVKLVVDSLGDKQHWEIDLAADGAPINGARWTVLDGAGDRVRYRLQYDWDLAALPAAALTPGDVLEYHLLAKDNYALNGQSHEPVASGKLRIHIVSQEQFADSITNELRTIAAQIGEIKSSQDRTHEETTALAEETADKDALDAADLGVAERLGGQQSTVASQAKQIAGKLDDVQRRLAENQSPATELNDLAGQVKDSLNQTAEGPMKAAANDIGTAQQPQTPEARNQALDDATSQQQQASDNLANALEQMNNIGGLRQTIDRVRALLEAQQQVSKETRELGARNIGKSPEQMSAEDRNKLQELADRQQKLSDRTEKAMRDMQELGEQMKRPDPTAAEALQRAASTGQQQQISSNQRRASESARRNQQSSAQSAQRQAELGLEMVMNQLREAERRKLEELSRKLAELQQQIQTLIRRQAGHNLDNLVLQGAEVLAQIDEATRTGLLARAEREADAPGQSTLPQLSQSQEQTERNTRDIAQSVQDQPDGSEAASRLVRAAGRMERAIVSLRGQKLPEAYDPAQVEALAALVEADQVVQEQKREVDEQRQQQQKEAIRQAYIRIKQEQEKLNGEVVRIDRAPRLDDGSFRREDAVRVGQLPGEQGTLEDEIRKLDEALAAVNSVVYLWANKDIAEAMSGVKDALGQKQTGALTQAEQKRIVDQLDAMITNLAIKPQERRFENRQAANGGGAGGGGGGQQPRLPGEAELQLLKEFQKAINASTKDQDARPEKSEPQLLALGQRQGDLRDLLDQLLQNASQGQVKLGPEPDIDEQLPEEANREEVENQELDDDLLTGDPEAADIEKETNLIGDRMARSRQRLAINHDPGETTQLIQERIIIDLDQLIDEARQQQQQQQQQQAQQQPRPGEQRPDPGQAQAQNQGAQPQQNQPQNSARQSDMSQGGDPQADLAQEIEQSAREWGQISPRARDAVIEGAREEPIEKYRRLIEDYYRGVATRTTQER